MWNNLPLKYYEGAKPGSKRKSNLTSDEKKAKSSKYESHRKKRSFSSGWQTGRDWLVFDSEKDVMTCSVCIQYYSRIDLAQSQTTSNLKNQDTFITGCSNFRLSTITDHEIADKHDKALSWSKAKERPVEQSNAGKALINLKSAERHRLCFLFRNAHAVCKQNRPLSDYEWLCKIDKAKDIDLGQTYLKEKAALDFLSYISATEKNKTTSMLQKAPFFSFMMDGSTNIAGDEQEAVFVRMCTKGDVTERFLFMGTPTSTASADLFDYVSNVFADYGIEQGKLVGMGSDGASNMVGIRSGLSTRMRDICPEMINIHCLCHRLELSFRDVIKSNKLYDKLMTLLVGFHYFYTKQYKNKAGLKRAIEAVGNKGKLPPKVTGTRWLPHLSSGISCLVETFQAYEAHLSTISHSNPKAEGLLKLMVNKHVVAFMLFLQMLIEPLMKLSLKLQRTESSLSDSLIWVETTLELLDEAKNKSNDQLLEVLESGTFQGIALKGPRPCMAYKDTLAQGFVDAIQQRFQMLDAEKHIYHATKVLNLKRWPTDPNMLRDFGNDEIKMVCDHFSNTLVRVCPEFSQNNALSEWILLKKVLRKRFGSKLSDSKWNSLLEAEDDDFINITLLIDLMLTLPPTSVSCETTFSQMKLIKTSRRTRLKSSTLNNLMLVKLESPEIEDFIPDEYVEQWLTGAKSSRRISYIRKSTGQKPVQDEADCDIHTVAVDETPDDTDLNSEDEISYINMLCGDKFDANFCDFQDEAENTAKLLGFLRDS